MPWVDPGISQRILRRVNSDFASNADDVARLLEKVESGNQDRERVIAAVVLGARGELGSLLQMVELSLVDWRDVLVEGGLDSADWSRLLDQHLGESDWPPE